MKIIVNKDLSYDIRDSLENLGFTVINADENKNLLNGLTTHPDMQIVFLGNTAVCEPGLFEYYSEVLTDSSITLIKGKTQTRCNYPDDIAYNIKVVGNNIFHNFKYTDREIMKCISSRNLIDVRQGYSGCSICIAGDNAIITADPFIHKRAIENGLDSIIITSGHIQLPFFDYGFIGGASFYSDGKVYFFGNVSKHPDFYEISKFCYMHGSEIHSLGNGILLDYGSAFTFE